MSVLIPEVDIYTDFLWDIVKFAIGQTSNRLTSREVECCYSYIKVSTDLTIDWGDNYSFQAYIVVSKFLISLPWFW